MATILPTIQSLSVVEPLGPRIRSLTLSLSELLSMDPAPSRPFNTDTDSDTDSECVLLTWRLCVLLAWDWDLATGHWPPGGRDLCLSVWSVGNLGGWADTASSIQHPVDWVYGWRTV